MTKLAGRRFFNEIWQTGMLALFLVMTMSAPEAKGQQNLSSKAALPASGLDTVTFQSADASPLDLIRAIGRQTRTPIGIAFGYDFDALTRPRHVYLLDKVDRGKALAVAIAGTGYLLKIENGVTVLTAGDLTTRQQTILEHQFTDFHPGTDHTMAELAFTLYMWIGSVLDPEAGFGGSILGSLDDERFTIAVPDMATTEEIANLIVSQGSKGLWMLKVDPTAEKAVAGLSFTVEPYAHQGRESVFGAPHGQR